MSVPVKIYDKNLEIVADLDKAYDVTYTKSLNEVWTGSFSFPADNDKNDLIQGHYYAELFDSGKRVGLFRIDEPIEQRDDNGAYVTYECSHVLDTLNDDYIGKTGKVTKSGAKTTVQHIVDQHSDWQLGDFEFTKAFDYEFSRQTLLDALLSVPQPWWEDWQLTFNTRSYPWTLNVKQPNTDPKGTLRYSKNVVSLERDANYKQIITRLYPYGEGSGDDQTDISSANPTGNKYIDSDNTSEYGVIVDVWEEQYFDNSNDLFQASKKYLNRHDSPRVTYRGAAADLYQLTSLNRFRLGEYVTVYDPDLDLDVQVRVTELRKGDVTGNPGRLSLELSNKSRRFPNYGSLAFKDQATEENLAPGSVSGSAGLGGGGALASGGVGTSNVANKAINWDKVQFKTDDGYFEQSLMKINSIVSFENNFTEIDKLDDGTTYAKMRKDWRSASDVTKIAGGEIYTDSVDLDRINFSPTASKNIVGQINANDNGITIDAELIEIDGTTKFVSNDFDPSTKLGETETAVNTEQVQNYTIIEGGRIKTGILEASVIRYDGGTLVVDENGNVEIEYDANKTEDHTSNDTENVNGTSATTIDTYASNGNTAHSSLSLGAWDLSDNVALYPSDNLSISQLRPAQANADKTSDNAQPYSWHNEKFDFNTEALYQGDLDLEGYSNFGSLTGDVASENSLDFSADAGTLLTGVGGLATQSDANWSNDIIGTDKPNDNADVTNLNTANDTDNVDGKSSATVKGWALKGDTGYDSLSLNDNYSLSNNLVKYSSGSNLDDLEPKQANADVTNLNTANDTANVSGTSATTIDTWADNGNTAHGSLSFSDNYSLSQNLVKYDSGVDIDDLEPKQADADETKRQVNDAFVDYVDECSYKDQVVVTDIDTDTDGHVTNVTTKNILFLNDFTITQDTFLSPNFS